MRRAIMPYITPHDRRKLVKILDECKKQVPDCNAGDLNYLITSVMHLYLGDNTNYQRYNDALGVLEGVKLELYREKIAEYEDLKINENGDV